MRFVTKTQGAFLLTLNMAISDVLWYPCWLKGDDEMAKNRIIPFGYCMRNGKITTEPKEVYAVATIFSEYLNGSSLMQIANLMESEKIRYTADSDH